MAKERGRPGKGQSSGDLLNLSHLSPEEIRTLKAGLIEADFLEPDVRKTRSGKLLPKAPDARIDADLIDAIATYQQQNGLPVTCSGSGRARIDRKTLEGISDLAPGVGGGEEERREPAQRRRTGPVPKDLVNAVITGGRPGSGFGMRMHPTQGEWKRHNGLDIPAPEGTEILAPSNGRVKTQSTDARLGNYVKLDHGGGVESIYGHMVRHRRDLRVGDLVTAGTPIGYVGSTGDSTGNHVHVGLKKNGQYLDPLKYQALILNPEMRSDTRIAKDKSREPARSRLPEADSPPEDIATSDSGPESNPRRAELYGKRDPRVALIRQMGREAGYGHLLEKSGRKSEERWDSALDRFLVQYAKDHRIRWKPGKGEPTKVLAALHEQVNTPAREQDPPRASSPRYAGADGQTETQPAHTQARLPVYASLTSASPAEQENRNTAWWTGEASKLGESSPEVKRLQELARAAGYWHPLNGDPQEKWGYSTTEMLGKVARAHQLSWREGEDIHPLIDAMQHDLEKKVTSVFGQVAGRRQTPSLTHSFEALAKGGTPVTVSRTETPAMVRIQKALEVLGHYPMPDGEYSKRGIEQGLAHFAEEHGIKHGPGAVSKQLLRALGQEAEARIQSLQTNPDLTPSPQPPRLKVGQGLHPSPQSS